MIHEVVQPADQAAADEQQQMLNQLAVLPQYFDDDLCDVTIHADGRVTLDIQLDNVRSPLRQLAAKLTLIQQKLRLSPARLGFFRVPLPPAAASPTDPPRTA